jgi:hypothetical protein
MILEHEDNIEIVLVDGYGHKDHFEKNNYVEIINRIKPTMRILKFTYSNLNI